MERRTLSSLNPVFYTVIVFIRRMKRRFNWCFQTSSFAKTFQKDLLPYRVKKHQSVLIRKLGDSDIKLQENKVVNLSIAINQLNQILIQPGETFSFCYLVGKPTKKKGYLEGMLLCNGKAIAGTGGGLCQLSNLIHWLVMHSPLTVTERHHHSFDPFPDQGRVVPFGSGATIFYNYMDYQFINNTKNTYQLIFWMDQKCLNGELRVDEEPQISYHIYEKNHKFTRKENQFYRQNEIWRKTFKKRGGALLKEERLIRNYALVKYHPEEYESND